MKKKISWTHGLRHLTETRPKLSRPVWHKSCTSLDITYECTLAGELYYLQLGQQSQDKLLYCNWQLRD